MDGSRADRSRPFVPFPALLGAGQESFDHDLHGPVKTIQERRIGIENRHDIRVRIPEPMLHKETNELIDENRSGMEIDPSGTDNVADSLMIDA